MDKEEANAAFAVVQDALNKAVMGQLPIGIAASPLHHEIFRSLQLVAEALKAHFVEKKEEEKSEDASRPESDTADPPAMG